MMIKFSPTEYRWSIECGCGTPHHRLCVYHDTDFNLSEITFTVGGTTFRQKLRAAWEMMRGYYDYHDIILTDAGIDTLQAAIAQVKELRQNHGI